MSERILKEIKEKGGLKACLKYLEYLTVDMKVQDTAIHTELACLYVQYITSILRQYYVRGSEEGTGSQQLDMQRADNDKNLFGK